MGFFKSFKKRPSNKNRVRLCPHCMKPTLEKAYGAGFITPDYFNCKNCDYSGPVFIEFDPEHPEKVDDPSTILSEVKMDPEFKDD